jgi:hypothetical protein
MKQVRKKARSIIISTQKLPTLEGEQKERKEARESENQETTRRRNERRSSHHKK